MQTPTINSARALNGVFRLEGFEGTQDFRLADLEVETDVLAGKTTNGLAGWGRIMRIMPGIGFEVDNGTQRSILWSQFWLLQPTLKQMAQTTRPATDLRRTDSGADYGQPGYPDCAWWEAQGVAEPLFVATPSVYGRYTSAAPALQVERLLLEELLTEADDGTLEAEGPFRRAWNRQKAQCLAKTGAGVSLAPQCVLDALQAALDAPVPESHRCTVYTGPIATLGPSVPAAAVRSLVDLLPAHLRPTPLVARAEKPIRGQGIVGFREPATDGCTQREYRARLLPAIRMWLTEELPRQAKEAALDWDIGTIAGKADINRGAWPGARLYWLTQETERAGIQWPWVPADYTDRYFACALWAAEVCERFLTGSGRVESEERGALRFLTVDRLSDGRKLMDLWNWSRFGPLRDAPPLSDEESAPDAEEAESESEAEAEAEEAEEDEADGGGLLGVGDGGDWLTKGQSLTLPGWVWMAFLGWLLTYMWMVAYVVGRR